MPRAVLDRGVALDAVRSDIASRLRRICENFAEAEFDALVARMAEIEVRYRLRDDWMLYREAISQVGSPRRSLEMI